MQSAHHSLFTNSKRNVNWKRRSFTASDHVQGSLYVIRKTDDSLNAERRRRSRANLSQHGKRRPTQTKYETQLGVGWSNEAKPELSDVRHKDTVRTVIYSPGLVWTRRRARPTDRRRHCNACRTALPYVRPYWNALRPLTCGRNQAPRLNSEMYPCDSKLT